MAGSFSNYTETAILNYIFRGTSPSFPATGYVALFTTAPSDAGTGGTEVANANGYQRVSIAMSSATFGAASSGNPSSITNSAAAISFPTATTGSWGTVVAFGIYDSGTYGAGNLLVWADLTTSKTVNVGDTASFATSQLTVTLD